MARCLKVALFESIWQKNGVEGLVEDTAAAQADTVGRPRFILVVALQAASIGVRGGRAARVLREEAAPGGMGLQGTVGLAREAMAHPGREEAGPVVGSVVAESAVSSRTTRETPGGVRIEGKSIIAARRRRRRMAGATPRGTMCALRSGGRSARAASLGVIMPGTRTTGTFNRGLGVRSQPRHGIKAARCPRLGHRARALNGTRHACVERRGQGRVVYDSQDQRGLKHPSADSILNPAG